jgi:L-arabinose isomerase
VSARRPRVALLSPYWDFWERSATIDLRADRRRLAEEVVAALGDGFEPVAAETFDSLEGAAAAGARIRAAGTDAVLVVQSMAVPPAYTLAALAELDQSPVVVLAVHRRSRLPASYGEPEITADGATVGTSQLANVLERRGRRWSLVVGRLGDATARDELRRAVRAAAVARWLRSARIGVVGVPPPGYECVECDPVELARATGIELVPIEPRAVAGAYRGASQNRTAELELEAREAFDLAPDATSGEALARSLRLAAALEALAADLRVDGGAMNCHVPEIRFAAEPGITPCYALGRETSRGIPWTCAGDAVTAVAMLTAKWLGAATLYHELESIDYETGELAIANTGEHDLGWASATGRRTLGPNPWFRSDPRRGVCARYPLAPGPATLVAFTPHPGETSGFRYVVAEGETTGRDLGDAGTPNGGFRFAALAPDEGFRRWALAGANHHSCASPGLLAASVADVARFLDVGCVRVE